MTRVEVGSYTSLLDASTLRIRYEKQKWKEENPDYDDSDETVILTSPVFHTEVHKRHSTT